MLQQIEGCDPKAIPEEARSELDYLEKLEPYVPELQDRLDELRRSFNGAGGLGRDAAPALLRLPAPTPAPTQCSEVADVARYLDASEDHVRLQAASGRLGLDLAQSPSLTSNIGGQSMVLCLRSWCSADDAAEERRIQADMIQLTDEAAVLRRLIIEIDQQTERDTEALNTVQDSMARGRESVDVAVRELSAERRSSVKAQNLVIPSIALGLGLAVPIPGVNIVGAVAAKAVIGVGAAGITSIARGRILEWNRRTLETLRDHFDQVLEPLPSDLLKALCSRGDEARERLLGVFDAPWQRYWQSFRALFAFASVGRSLRIYRQASRGGGQCRGPLAAHAIMACFEAPLAPKDAFEVVRRQHVYGSLDPGCDVCWNLPVHGDGSSLSDTTAVRYKVYSSFFVNREFCVVNRAGCAGDNRYIIAVSSLPDDELPGCIRSPPSGIARGNMYACGVVVEKAPDSGPDSPRCAISVIADIDPNFPHTLGVGVDNIITGHVVKTVKCISDALRN